MENIVELQIVQDYKNGETIKHICEKYHFGYYKIADVLDRYNIPHSRKTKKEAKKKELLSNTEEIIQYYQSGNGLTKTAKKFGVYSRDIKNILNQNEIHVRSFQETLSQRERDEDFFKKESHEMAWLLGFLAADGSISSKNNAITIQLAKKDKEILEKIRFLIGIPNNITEYTTSTGFDVVSYRWSCAEHKKDLASFNIIPNKTFKLKPPYKLSSQYYIDYIRGYFDGDGSINLIKNFNGRGNGNLRWQISSATAEILDFILKVFEENGVPKVNIQKRLSENGYLYTIAYSSVATRNIYSFLYNDSWMFLQRKRDRYEEILDMVDSL